MQALLGNVLDRIIADAYRAHNAPAEHKFSVYTAGQKRRVNQQIKREFKRRAAIEPVIGHLKDDHRMSRNYLAHSSGDDLDAMPAALGYKLLPPHSMAEAFDAQNPDRRQFSYSAQIGLIGFFTGDE
jgi:hypothetical protein